MGRLELSIEPARNQLFRVIQPTTFPPFSASTNALARRRSTYASSAPCRSFPKRRPIISLMLMAQTTLLLLRLIPKTLDEVIAVVRYDRQAGSEKAEYAALVENRWQDHGVGTGLTRRLADEAREKGGRFLLRAGKGPEYAYAQRSAAPRSSRARATSGRRQVCRGRASIRRRVASKVRSEGVTTVLEHKGKGRYTNGADRFCFAHLAGTGRSG